MEGISWGNQAEDSFSKVSAQCAVGSDGGAGSFEQQSFLLGEGRAEAQGAPVGTASGASSSRAAVLGRRKRKRMGGDRGMSLDDGGCGRVGVEPRERFRPVAATAAAIADATAEQEPGQAEDEINLQQGSSEISSVGPAAPRRRKRGR